MSRVKKTVTVELLRHGTAHNQLLSPLTQYLGLCGNFGAATVCVPYEHRQFLSRLKVLRYADGQGGDDELRQSMLEETSQEITSILKSLPGLISELGSPDGNCSNVVHLNLVLSAAELAMLPFELANVPPGCAGGEGNSLLLQNRLKISMTRQVRNVANVNLEWSRKPRILFIIAEPGALTVPAVSHARALRKVIAPWVSALDDSDKATQIREREALLTIITEATRAKIKQAVHANQYSHVHILAHGMADETDDYASYGLALHQDNEENQIDLVDGNTLAALLCPLAENRRMPSVVTVSSCDSGNTRSVISSTGSSLAHELHHAGVPFVVASQFPLSKKASSFMPEVLYQSLLWGEDPRISVARLRDNLKIHCPNTHDWASVICYATLPDDLEEQLTHLRYAQSKRAIDAAMKIIDQLIAEISKSEVLKKEDEWKNYQDTLIALFSRVDEADAMMPVDHGYETEGMGMKASNLKRKSQANFRLALLDDETSRISLLQQSVAELRQSFKLYQRAYQSTFRESSKAQIRRSAHWVLGQYLSLNIILGQVFKPREWNAAILSCDIDLGSSDKMTLAWAHGSMSELYLILLGYSDKYGFARYQECQNIVLNHISSLIKLVDAGDFAIQSTLRQYRRYLEWWGHDVFRETIKQEDYLRSWKADFGIIDTVRKAIDLLENTASS